MKKIILPLGAVIVAVIALVFSISHKNPIIKETVVPVAPHASASSTPEASVLKATPEPITIHNFCNQFQENKSFFAPINDSFVIVCGGEFERYGTTSLLYAPISKVYLIDRKATIQWKWEDKGGFRTIYIPTIIDLNNDGHKELKFTATGYGGSCGTAFSEEIIYDPLTKIQGSLDSWESMEIPANNKDGDCRDTFYGDMISDTYTPAMYAYFKAEIEKGNLKLLQNPKCHVETSKEYPMSFAGKGIYCTY